MKKLLFYWERLMSTFWFLPVLIIFVAVLLSMILVTVDSYVSTSQEGWQLFFLVDSSNSARTILSTISGAMIGVAGTVFSVTLVVLTLASSQFGPRLIRNFMYIKINQIVLGSYVSTYLYCLLILNGVKEGIGYSYIPSISILVAIIAAIVNIILLIVFIHQVAISIQADKVISNISSFISNQVENLFPENLGKEIKEDADLDFSKEISNYKFSTSIISPKNGYFQYVDNDTLMHALVENDLVLELYHRPGKFLVKGSEIGLVFSKSVVKEEYVDKLTRRFEIGKTKTSQQDLVYSIQQMVEIGVRALSPGINDPFTAIACIDNLTATMCYLANVKFPSKYRFDEKNNLRVVTDKLDFEEVLDAAFNQIRQFSGGNAAVINRMMETLTIILSFTEKDNYKKAVLKHAQMVLNMGAETIKEENDLKDLTDMAEKILKSKS